MQYRVQNKMSSLDALFATAEKIEDEEVQGHFAKYLCVKSSGLLESYMKAQISDYVDSTCAKPASLYIRNKIKRLTNIDYEKLLTFLQSFSNDWKDSFEREMNPELKASLNTIISNRNNIAHGNSDNISFRSIKIHYANLKRVLGILDAIVTR